METPVNIPWIKLILGYLMLVFPLFAFWYYRTGLIRDTLTATARMTIQLLLAAVYLEFLFRINHPLLNLLWVFVMVLAAAFTTIRRSRLNRQYFIIPVIISTISCLCIIDVFFIGLLLDFGYLFNAEYLIPVSGIILGNSLRTNIIALNTYYSQLKDQQEFYRFCLANGATRGEATAPFIRESIRQAFNPAIANIAVVGVVNMPGVMTGQILGGSSPEAAIKYQILIMLAILSSAMITVILTLHLSKTVVFDDFGNIRPVVFDSKFRNIDT